MYIENIMTVQLHPEREELDTKIDNFDKKKYILLNIN